MEKYCPKCFKKYPLDTERCPEDGSYLVSPMDKDLTGQVLDDRYTVMERIGKGGMGVVYKAEQHLIKRIVALKVLRREIVQDESAVKRFLTEARAIATLDSRHTVTLYDFGVTRDGLLYYTMELLTGRTLSRIIRDEAPLDHVRAAGLLLQACRSLGEAHEHNILHRDLKPENFIVTVKREREELKVLDFGIAKLVGDASTDTLTQAGMIVGTPQYLSPEQAQGNTVVPPSDLYSLGIVLYEMLAGSPPFNADTPMKTLWAHIRDPVPPLTKTNPKVEVPRSIEAFLARALEKEPGDRFQSATTFAEALQRAVEDHDASPETVSLPLLSSTDQGLRIRTQAWKSEQVEEGKAKIGDYGESREEGTGTALLGVSGAVVPGQQEALVSEKAVEQQEPEEPASSEEAQGIGLSETVWAESPAPSKPLAPDEELDNEPSDVCVEDKEPAPELEVDEQPGPATMGLILPGHRSVAWGTGVGASVALVIGLMLWAPWRSGDEGESPVEPVDSVAQARDEENYSESEVGLAGAKAVTAARSGFYVVDDATRALDVAVLVPAASDVVAPADTTTPADVVDQTGLEESSRSADVLQASPPLDGGGEPDVSVDVVSEHQDKSKEEANRKAEEKKKAEAGRKAEAEKKRKAEAKRNAEEARRKAKANEKLSKADRLVGEARSKMKKGRYEQALARLNEAAASGGEASTIGKLRGKCYAGIKAREIKKLLGRARTAKGRADYAACIDAAGRASKLDPGNGEAFKLLKECKEKQELEGMKF